MPSLLVHITCGPENPTKATLAFFIAAAAVEAGYEVHVFLAGDAVQLLREPVRNALTGLGTGALLEDHCGRRSSLRFGRVLCCTRRDRRRSSRSAAREGGTTRTRSAGHGVRPQHRLLTGPYIYPLRLCSGAEAGLAAITQ
jgi:hypothetical protein